MTILHTIGTIIADCYQLDQVLGQGSMGVTYRATDLRTDESVAIKAVSLRNVRDWKVLELFERETHILQNLRHGAIPRYLDSIQVDTPEDRYFYLVQTLAPGQSLDVLVNQGWYPTETDIKQIAVQLLDVLRYLHQLKPPIIHRDIKPQNILRHVDGRLFLVDFGSVQDIYRNTLTRGGTFVGTLGYMAPEQFRGQVSPASDLYSLGATLLFVLTAQAPADLPQQRMRIDFRDRIALSQPMADWLARLLEPMLEDRFPSAQAALDDLQRLQLLTRSSGRASSHQIVFWRYERQVIIHLCPSQGYGLLNIWLGFTALLASLPILYHANSKTGFLTFLGLGIWLGLLWTGWRYLYSEQVEIDTQRFRLTRYLAMIPIQRLQLPLADIERASVDSRLATFSLRRQINRLSCVVWGVVRDHQGRRQGVHRYEFGEALSDNEMVWLMSELSAFLNQIRSSP